MTREVFNGAIIAGIITILTISILPGMAQEVATGVVSPVNLADDRGIILRTDDGSNSVYIFFSLEDLVDPTRSLAVGDRVSFSIDPENDMHAIGIGLARR